MRLLVGPNRELRNVAGNVSLRQVEAHHAAPGAALRRIRHRYADTVRNEVGFKPQPALRHFRAEIIRLAVEPALEVKLRVENEVEVLIEVDDRRRVGNGDEARRRLARSIEMLVPAIHRNAE